ncbi:MAG: LemA family protein [Paludibacteraceae bacterium]|nr:LemA family protein [Paludibacteraceae bacterium]
MNKSTLIVLGVLAAAVLWVISTYNGLVDKEEKVKTAWANVESQYQRRSDLIPNLVTVVKGYATHEKETFEAVVKARAEATQIKLSMDDLNDEKLAQLEAAQNTLGGALGRLMAISENYPDLKANEQFLELQAQLTGTENRIAFVRSEYNKITKEYDTEIRLFPTSLIANLFGFKEYSYFKSDEGASSAPSVNL